MSDHVESMANSLAAIAEVLQEIQQELRLLTELVDMGVARYTGQDGES